MHIRSLFCCLATGTEDSVYTFMNSSSLPGAALTVVTLALKAGLSLLDVRRSPRLRPAVCMESTRRGDGRLRRGAVQGHDLLRLAERPSNIAQAATEGPGLQAMSGA